MIHKLQAVVLWSRRSHEADKIVGVFTNSLGRVTVRATSAAYPKARLAAMTEPFVHAEMALHLIPGRGWGKLVGGQLVESFPRLRTEVSRTTAAAWVCELVARLTAEEQPSPE